MAKSVNNLDEKEEMLTSALTLCKSVAPNINLKEIGEQFTAQKSYNAVIDLAITCAKKMDPENVGEHFYKNGEKTDQDGYQYYAKRREIYKVVVAMLETIYSQNDGSQSIRNISCQMGIASTEGLCLTKYCMY